MSVSIDHEGHELIVRGDFQTVREKEQALFLGELMTSGGMRNIPTQRGEDVHLEIAPDVAPAALESICRVAGVEVDDSL